MSNIFRLTYRLRDALYIDFCSLDVQTTYTFQQGEYNCQQHFSCPHTTTAAVRTLPRYVYHFRPCLRNRHSTTTLVISPEETQIHPTIQTINISIMFTSSFMSFRILILPLLFVIIIPRAALSQSDFQHRYKQRSPSNYDLCFTDTSMCTNSFVSEMSHCLERLEDTENEEEFGYCICAMHQDRHPAWNTCSECLRRNYNDQTLVTWSSECKSMPIVMSGNPNPSLSGGKVCKCKKC